MLSLELLDCFLNTIAIIISIERHATTLRRKHKWPSVTIDAGYIPFLKWLILLTRKAGAT